MPDTTAKSFPLPGADSTGPTEARRLQSKLRDMRDSLDQYLPSVVHNADGRVHLARLGMFPDFADNAPYPRLSPLAHLEPLDRLKPLLHDGEDDESLLHFRNASLVRQLDDSIRGAPLETLVDLEGQIMLARSHVSGFKANFGFQILWVGERRQWKVLEGTVYWAEMDYASGFTEEKQFTTERAWLDGLSGYVILPLTVQPRFFDSATGGRVFDEEGYTMTVGKPELVFQPKNSAPVRSMGFSGNQDTGGTFTRSWSAGSYQYALARVLTPSENDGVPGIFPIVLGDLNFTTTTNEWQGSLPPP